MIKKEVRSMFAGRVWVHAKYLNEAFKKGVPLQLVFAGKGTMTIPHTDLKERFDRKKPVQDKFQPAITHMQYGIPWKAD